MATDTLRLVRTMYGHRVENHGVPIGKIVTDHFGYTAFDMADIEIPLSPNIFALDSIATAIWVHHSGGDAEHNKRTPRDWILAVAREIEGADPPDLDAARGSFVEYGERMADFNEDQRLRGEWLADLVMQYFDNRKDA